MPKYRVEVDQMLCQGHGICTEECPENFEVMDVETGYPKVNIKNETPGEDILARVQDAVMYCPNQALKLIEIE